MTTSHKSAKSSAKDVFLYLLMIIMLAIGVSFFITLLWQYINVQLPDPLSFSYYGSMSLIRAAISALVIVWPVLLLSSWFINKDVTSSKEKANVWIRKWLLYLTLFVSALTIIIDLITLVNSFLGGELTTRFLLKVLVILVVASCVFGFYLWELRRDVSAKTSMHTIVAISTSLLVVVWIGLGFAIVGSPAQQRDVRFDEARINNLSEIENQVINYWVQKDALPEDLSAIGIVWSGYQTPVDPETGIVYTYRTTGLLSFELCATFATDSSEVGSRSTPVRSAYETTSTSWDHTSGDVCFVRTIDPDLYNQDPVAKPVF